MMKPQQKDATKPTSPPPERRSGEGSQSALERLRALEKAKAVGSLERLKRRFFG
jgi:hypothetical protein